MTVEGGTMTNKISAIFIDGVFHIQTREIEYEAQSFYFPRLRPFSVSVGQDDKPVSYERNTFTRVGTLPDGRRVYGLARLNLKLWMVEYSWTPQAASDELVSELRKQAERHIQAITRGKYLHLCERKRSNPDSTFTREHWGVGTPAVAGCESPGRVTKT